MNEPPTDSGTSSDDSQEDVSTSSIQHHKKPEKMESVILTDKEQSSAPTYTLYKRRWFMVFIFSSVCAANNILWLTFSTVGQTAITYYHTDAFSIDVHSIIFQVSSKQLVHPIASLPTYRLFCSEFGSSPRTIHR